MRRFWNDPRRCLRVAESCSGWSLVIAFATAMSGLLGAPWAVLLTLIPIGTVLLAAAPVLNARADRLLRQMENDRDAR